MCAIFRNKSLLVSNAKFQWKPCNECCHEHFHSYLAFDTFTACFFPHEATINNRKHFTFRAHVILNGVIHFFNNEFSSCDKSRPFNMIAYAVILIEITVHWLHVGRQKLLSWFSEQIWSIKLQLSANTDHMKCSYEWLIVLVKEHSCNHVFIVPTKALSLIFSYEQNYTGAEMRKTWLGD